MVINAISRDKNSLFDWYFAAECIDQAIANHCFSEDCYEMIFDLRFFICKLFDGDVLQRKGLTKQRHCEVNHLLIHCTT